jgi:hypothetical protein
VAPSIGIFRNKVDAHAIYWKLLALRLSTKICGSIFRVFFIMFRLKFLLPSSGIFSNLKISKNFVQENVKISVFDFFPEEGIEKRSRNIRKFPEDGI